MKDQKKTPGKELNETDTSNLSDKQYKSLVITMLTDLSENFNKEIGNIKKEVENKKKNQPEMKNTLDGINSRSDEAENPISDLEDKVLENIQLEQQKEKGI